MSDDLINLIYELESDPVRRQTERDKIILLWKILEEKYLRERNK